MRLRKILIALVAVAGLALVGVAGAQAAPIRECANFVPTGQAHGTWAGYWTYATIPGFTPVYNLTTRSIACSDARRFSLYVTRHGSHRYHRFSCRWIPDYESYDVRCTRGRQVVHWQGGA